MAGGVLEQAAQTVAGRAIGCVEVETALIDQPQRGSRQDGLAEAPPGNGRAAGAAGDDPALLDDGDA